MSKQQIKKFRKNDYSYDEQEDYYDNRSNYLEKKKQKKVDRALRTKDISALLEDEEDVTGFEINYSTFEEDNL
jgi:hypothetical protein